MNKTFKSLLSICAALMLVIPAFAQVTTSSMNGKITDSAGAPVAGATVVAVHAPSGTQYYAVANAEGRYFINGMRAGGPYVVEFSCLGYSPVKFSDVVLELAVSLVLDADLPDDSQMLEGAIAVSEAVSKITTEKTGAATNISNRQITEMPTVSRSLTDVAKLSPYGGNGMNFSGSSGRSANFTVDGANVNNNFGLSTALPGGGNPISLDAIEEVQVVVSPYDVRQSNFIGGGINAITKSGTNKVKGTAYIYHQNENMHGCRIDDVDIERSKDRQTTYGVTIGGPIVKNKLFFFVSAEKVSTPAEANNWRPSPDGVANPDKMLSRVSVAEASRMKDFLMNTYKYDPGAYDSYPADQSNIKILGRIDWNISNNHKFALRYNYTNNNSWKLPSTSRDVSDMVYGTASEYGLVFSNSMYNQMNNLSTISADLNSRFSDVVSNQLLVTYSNIQDVRGFNGDFFPFVEILAGDVGGANEPYMDFGTELFTYRNNVQNTVLTVKDDVTIFKGDHKITAGASYEAQMALNTYMRNGTGMYRFASLSDFYNGKAPVEMAFDWGFDGDETPSAKVRFTSAGAYVQDEWNVTDRFLLNAGLRFDTIIFNNADVMTNQAALALDYGGRSVDTGQWPRTNIQISPRIGFSWDVLGDKSLKIRGGTGLFAGRLPLVFFTNMPTNAGIVKGRLTKMSDPAVLAKMVGSDGRVITDRWEILRMLNSIDPKKYPTTITPETAPAPSEIAGVDHNFKMPQVWKSSVSIDYRVPVSFPLSFSGEVIFNKTINGVMLTNYNITDDNSGWASFNGVDSRHIYPSDYKYNKVDAFVLTNTNKGYGWMGSFSLKAQPVKGLDIIASYTHTVSKELTGMPGSNATAAWKYIPSVEGPNFNVLHNSSYNLPDRIMASVAYTDAGHNHFSLLYEGLRYSGNSYIYANDINGDGNAYDLMYIPKDESEIRFIDADNANRYWEFANQDAYLSANKGKYAEAYAVSQPFRHVFDFRYAHDFVFNIGKSVNTIQLSADIQNVSNLFNSRWGVSKSWNSDVSHDSNGNAKILKLERTDADGVPVFSTTVGSGVPTWDFTHSLANCWYMQIGIRYLFN